VGTVGTVGTASAANTVGTAELEGAEGTATPATTIGPTSRLSERKSDMLNIKVVTLSLGIFGAVTFVACVLYGLVVPESLHMTRGLEIALPGFKWLTLTGFLIGFIESFLYGVYAGLVFVPIHNTLAKRWSAS
jgi:2TM family of unknown function (DUF5676)